jgi:hypothetical protein
VAIYHLSVKTVSRSAGRSATAAAAYRAGVKITDERTGEIHDYTRKGGVESADIVLPDGAPEWAADRVALWNAAEQAETRKNSTVAREFEIALPEELSPAERRLLALDLAREIVERHGCAADVAIHAPGKNGDNRNHHAHILLSTRRLGPGGFTEKTRELDDKKSGPEIVTEWRERWAALTNERLQERGIDARVDHRSLEAQGIDRVPTRHLGPAATGFERRTGEPSRRRLDFQEEAGERLAKAKAAGEIERQLGEIDKGIIDISTSISKVLREREGARAELERLAAERQRPDKTNVMSNVSKPSPSPAPAPVHPAPQAPAPVKPVPMPMMERAVYADTAIGRVGVWRDDNAAVHALLVKDGKIATLSDVRLKDGRPGLRGAVDLADGKLVLLITQSGSATNVNVAKIANGQTEMLGGGRLLMPPGAGYAPLTMTLKPIREALQQQGPDKDQQKQIDRGRGR